VDFFERGSAQAGRGGALFGVNHDLFEEGL
jgi:hypothetical protein